jgi:hypothetical protein
MKEKGTHYSEKGGHKDRSDFHRELRRYCRDSTLIPEKVDMWQVRFKMKRMPRSGK